MGGNGITATTEKLPGIVNGAQAGSAWIALGTVWHRNLPLAAPPNPGRTTGRSGSMFSDNGIGLAIETTQIEKVTQHRLVVLVYSTVSQFCIAYVRGFAALRRLPASSRRELASCLEVPVIGVVASANRHSARRMVDADRGDGSCYAGRTSVLDDKGLRQVNRECRALSAGSDRECRSGRVWLHGFAEP